MQIRAGFGISSNSETSQLPQTQGTMQEEAHQIKEASEASSRCRSQRRRYGQSIYFFLHVLTTQLHVEVTSFFDRNSPASYPSPRSRCPPAECWAHWPGTLLMS